jgi:nicotinate-nucleotide adenylyltransferase
MKRMRTCLFGGSFNPIHLGHTALARQLLDLGLADEVWLMVSPQNPLKSRDVLLPDVQRLQMVCLAVASEPGIRVCDYEFLMPRPSYMYYTLQSLQRSYPQREFSLLIGGDNWLHFDCWYHYTDILSDHTIYVYPRSTFSIDETLLPSTVHVLHCPLLDISSTDIRQRICAHQSLGGLVHPSVEKYIKENVHLVG